MSFDCRSGTVVGNVRLEFHVDVLNDCYRSGESSVSDPVRAIQRTFPSRQLAEN